ncbi:helix-turn-helix domain-containing protein [Streptomyces sp. 1222.5]|uniref:helix-turn-helix domain-containing protein n=1 Tax=Streptomyces sp. 1222.5 TaxID=1881026 RepID=UPI003D7537B5
MTDEQRVAQYRRADPAKMPRTPLGQQASVEGTVAALGATEATREHNRRRLAARRLEVDETAAGKLRAAVSALIEEYEEQREAERRQYEAAEGTGLDLLADGFREATSTAKRHDLAEAVGSSLPLAEAGVIRRTAKAVEEALPGIVVDARVDGWSAKEIAAELDVTPSYVYRMIKEYPWEAAWALYVMPDGWTSNSDDEPWEQVADGTEESPGETADQLAARILDERLDDSLATKRVRVCVWRTGDGNDLLDARGEAERDPADSDA